MQSYKLLGMRHPNDWPDWIFWLPFIGFMLMMPTVLFLARKKSSIQDQLNRWRFFLVSSQSVLLRVVLYILKWKKLVLGF